jgi:mannose-6-phosphate isomerase-like protein (cupin superfamily)
MAAYVTDIEEKTLKNSNFREVLNTTSRSQLVVMALKPGEDIGTEVHHDVDQFLRNVIFESYIHCRRKSC